MRYREAPQAEQNIDISPLIDMVFILLIFFMVSTTFVKDVKLDLHRPSAHSASAASSKAIHLYIDHNGAVFLDDEPLRIWVLQSRLRERLKSTTAKSVLVVTDKDVPAARLIEVVDQARLAGAKDVGVATEKEVGRS